MARNKYRKNIGGQEDDREQANTIEGQEQETKSKPLDINTILLGIILLILVVQTYMMITADDSPQVAGNYQTAPAVTPQEQPQGQPQTTLSPADLQAPATGNAVAVYSENEIDLGNLRPGQKVRHTFNVRNTGSDDLVYGDVSTDPGLLVVEGPQSTIPPGGTGAITVELSTQDLSGPVTKIVHVNSNSEPAHLHLEVKANVK